jgi:predicted esterase
MRRTTTGLIIILTASLAPTACDRGPIPATMPTDGAGAKPAPPLYIETPLPPPTMLDTGEDLRTIPEARLVLLARRLEKAKDYPHAAILQYWIVQRTNSGQYDLARFLSRSGTLDPAFYWLQVAALEEGVDPNDADRNEDLAALRADTRWNDVRTYLGACSHYFEASGARHTTLLLPAGYRNGTPIAAVVWLHADRSSPEEFVNESLQRHADALNVAILGVSGTVPYGPRKFVWTMDADRDAKRIRDGLAEVSDRVTAKPGHVIAIGFAQGAQVGVEIAVRNPEEFAGAIALSPNGDTHLQDVKPSPLLARRGFVITNGADEADGIVRLAAYDFAWLRDAKAQVRHKDYPGIHDHALPLDFHARFPEWVKWIEQKRGE